MNRTVSRLILTLLLINLLILTSGFQPNNVVAVDIENAKIRVKEISLDIPQPDAAKIGTYDWLKIPGCSYISTLGHPRLPVKSIVIRLPLGSVVEEVGLTVQNVTLEGFYQIVPSPTPKPLSVTEDLNDTTEPDPSIYESQNLYPQEWFSYRTANGLDDESHRRVTYVLIHFYPLRYLPKQRTITCGHKVSATIAYREPLETPIPTEQLDNIIITAPFLESHALRLGEWKNDTNISTRVMNTDWIYRNYPGIDHEEQIRNCIKDFVLDHGIRFVTIFGDADRVPVRYAYVPDPEAGETYVPTDLYYSDLDGTWDDNQDGLYADLRYDIVDGVPDVYVGRIPPSLIEYAEVAVDKIIGYAQAEKETEDWFNRSLLVSGHPHGDYDHHTDPEFNFSYLKDYISQYSAKETIKLYESAGNLTSSRLRSELNRGCAFANFAGHGNPESWLLYWSLIIFPVTFSWSDADGLTNGLKLPVVVTDSCSTARFDDKECIGERFVLNPNGGSIAYFGSTRIAWGYLEEWITEGLMGEMDWRIYQTYSEGYSKLGEMWGITVTRYLQRHGLSWIYDEKTVMEFVLLGDPTLNVGNKLRTDVSFTLSPNPAFSGETVTLSGNLTDAEGDPVYPAQVDLEYSTDGTTWNYLWTLDINADGEFFDTFTVPSPGAYLVSVSYAGNATYNPSSHTETFTVQEPLDTKISFKFDPDPATSGVLVMLLGNLKEVDDNPVYPAQVKVEYSTDGGTTWHNIWTLDTNVAGEFSQTFTAPGVGEYLVRVSYAGSATYNPSSHTETLTVIVTKVDTVLDFWFTPNPVPPGDTVTLSGTLETVGGSPVYPASVTVEYSTNGGATWNYIWTLSTNGVGEFSTVFIAPGVGEYLVRVSYTGDAKYNPSSRTEPLSVEEPALVETWIYFNFVPNPATPGVTIALRGILVDDSSNPIASASVRVEYSVDDGVSWNYIWTRITDGYGMFSQIFSAPGVGRYLVRINYTGDSTYESASSTAYLTVLSPAPLSQTEATAGAIFFNFFPNPANSGTTDALRGILLDDFGNPIASADVTVEYSTNNGAAWNPLWTLTTDSYGIFATTFTAPTGTYLVQITYGGSTITTYLVVLS